VSSDNDPPQTSESPAIMIATILKVITLAAPGVLAVMGLLAMYSSQTSRSKYIWTAAFVVAGLLFTAAAIKDSKSQEEQQTTMLMGGDNFPEIYGMNRDDGKLELMLANGKGTPLYDVLFSIAKAGNFNSIAAKAVGTLLSGATDIGVAIDQGAYQIDFNARNGRFIEMLYFGPCNGKLVQTRTITKPLEGGKIVQQSPDYLECFARH
jgi:hypothetical protein